MWKHLWIVQPHPLFYEFTKVFNINITHSNENVLEENILLPFLLKINSDQIKIESINQLFGFFKNN